VLRDHTPSGDFASNDSRAALHGVPPSVPSGMTVGALPVGPCPTMIPKTRKVMKEVAAMTDVTRDLSRPATGQGEGASPDAPKSGYGINSGVRQSITTFTFRADGEAIRPWIAYVLKAKDGDPCIYSCTLHSYHRTDFTTRPKYESVPSLVGCGL
jgi:hypothetical protein